MKMITLCSLAMLPTAAFAHAGEHAGIGLAGLAAHLLEPDHLFFAAAALGAGVLGWRVRRGVAVRVPVRKDRGHDPR